MLVQTLRKEKTKRDHGHNTDLNCQVSKPCPVEAQTMNFQLIRNKCATFLSIVMKRNKTF